MKALHCLAAIKMKVEDGFVFQEIRDELDLFPIAQRDHEWLKLSILLNIKNLLLPKETFFEIKKLKGLISNNEHEEFLKLIHKILYPMVLSHHGYNRSASFLDTSFVWRSLEEFSYVVKELGYQTFLVSGTLLGIVRDNKLIAHDDDIDVSIYLGNGSFEQIAERFNLLKDQLNELNLIDNSFKGTFFRIKLCQGVIIDAFPSWSKDNSVYVYPHTFGCFNLSDLLPFSDHSRGDALYTLPNNPKKLLTSNYGHNWKSPDPTWEFDWDNAKEVFYEFLDAYASPRLSKLFLNFDSECKINLIIWGANDYSSTIIRNLPCNIEVMIVLDGKATSENRTFGMYPMFNIREVELQILEECDAIILSTDLHQDSMKEELWKREVSLLSKVIEF